MKMTNSSEKDNLKIGDRIECVGYMGTIKYVGPIEGKPSLWLGIDWDETNRGKHNGTLNNNQYFVARSPTSGSFIRPDRVNVGKSAVASIELRYGQGEDEHTAKLNQQKHLLVQQSINAPFLEMVGFDKVFNIQSNFRMLKVVNLRQQNVNSVGPPGNLGEICPNIEELDISKNLFISWDQIIAFCDELPKLLWLNVSDNKLTIPESLKNVKYPNVRTLICGCLEINWADVCKITSAFPNLEEFRAPHNKIENLDLEENTLTSLKLLDVEGNKIVHWSEICKLGLLPSLEELIIQNVGLEAIRFEGEEEKVSIFTNLKKLCIVNNSIKEWLSVGELNRLPSLNHLKISKNPITESEDINTIHQLVVAKIANLKFLNGVEIENNERRGAEYDYIKKYGLEWLKCKGTPQQTVFLKEHDRYLELIEKYGELEESELDTKPKVLNSSLLSIKLICNNRTIEKKMPPSITVQKLTVLVQKMFKLEERPQLVYRSSVDTYIEIILDEEMKEIGVYGIQDGDEIVAR